MKTDIKHCARCGQDHNKLGFDKLTYPIEDSDGTLWTHWAPCPANGEPILLKVTEKKSDA